MQARYSILEQKAENLFKAQRITDDKPVMLKKVSFSSISPKKKEHIVNEVNTLIRMDYIHLLKYLDFEINKRDVTVDIVMEYCQGGTLQQLVSKTRSDNKRLPEQQIWRIFYQLAQALDYIHKDSVIHRDINPSHVYFKEAARKNIKLGGFSLAKKLDNQDHFQQTVLPNTNYLSPEQIQTGVCTMQTDIWALGCLMYEVCALQPPFKAANQFQRIKMIKEAKPKKLAFSTELNRVIFWCLEKDPDSRPTLSELLGTPEINLRIRERRYQEKNAQLLQKEEKLARRQKELADRQQSICREQKHKIGFESIKKRQIQSSRTFNLVDIGINRSLY